MAHARSLDRQLVARLHERARVLAVGPASILHVAWALVVSRTSGKDDVVFGTVARGQTLPVRIRLTTASVRDAVRETDRMLAELATLDGASLELAAQCSALSDGAPLFTASLEYPGDGSSRDPLVLSVRESDLTVTVRARGAIEPRQVCDMVAIAIEELVAALERDLATPVAALEILPPAERQRIVFDWNATARPYPRDRCIHELFEERVLTDGDAPAVIFDEITVSYARLNADANRLARHLVERGVRPGQRVAILLPRSIELVVAQLAIVKCGAAYVPLDERAPAERNAFMVEDCGARIVITRDLLGELALEAYASDNLNVAIDSSAAAYVMYTSGSTGEPKGCEVAHRSVGRLVFDNGYTPFTRDDRVAFVSNPAFDASMIEVWAPLYTGGAIVVIDRDTLLDPHRFARCLEARGVTILSLTVALFNRYAGVIADAFTRLRCLIVGGDKVDATIIADVVKNTPPARFVHAYGPTETTLFATTYHVVDVPDGASSIPIGRPISNTCIYILDSRGRPTPVGVAGELFIAGEGVARGYLNRPELTAERFVPDPFHGGRMYRTGDLARYLPDGNIEFLGRNDTQIKIRGFRVELGEIETRIMAFAGIEEALVIAVDEGGGSKRLVAYCTGTFDVRELKEHLRRSLPEYMVPTAYVRLDAFPLTANLKIDRRALPPPPIADAEQSRMEPLIAPSSPTEELVAGTWREVLGIDRLGVNDSFFELGGHSLMAMQVVSRIRDLSGVELSVRAFFDAPTIRELARAIGESAGSEVAEAIPRVSRTAPAPLSSPQEQQWLLHALDPSSAAYNIPFVLRLRGPLDVDALARSLDDVVRRHDVLRVTIANEDGRPQQRVSPPVACRLQVEPVASLREAEVTAAAEVRRSFDLERGPLIRARLLRIDATDHVFVLTMHHVVSDAWSCDVFRHELFATYESAETQPELAVRYIDYASWERARNERGALAKSLDYWRTHVAGAPLVLELPTDRPRPPVQTFTGARHGFVFSATTLEAIAKLCRAEHVTPFMMLFAVYGVLLHRYTGQDKILVGVPVANRNRTDTERMIGVFINTVAFAADLAGDPTFHELLERVRGATLRGFAHQELPFTRLVEELQPVRDPSRNPVVQVMFAYQNAAVQPPTRVAGLTVTRLPIETGTSKFDLMLELEPQGSELACWVEYNTDLFDAATIARFAQHFEVLVEALVADPKARVSEVSLLTAAERHQLLVEWNDTARAFPEDQRIEQLFEAQVERTPDAVALGFEGTNLTYRELNTRANQLAHRLRELGVGPDVLVPICVERSLEMLVGMFGILKAGGAYVPLDPEYPPERLAFMLKDSEPPVILTQARFRARLPPDATVLYLDRPDVANQPRDNPPRLGTAESLAYGMYTSGSTGTPKCALVMQRSVVNLVSWLQDTYQLDDTDRMLQKTPLSFDISVSELFWPVLVGARLVIARPEGHKDVRYLLDVIRDEQITTIDFVPSMLDIFVQEPALADCVSLRRVLACGEALSYDVQARFFARSRAELHNIYGPTETTVYSSCWRCQRTSKDRTVPIGRPIANTRMHVLDARRQPVPIGVSGELYIGGAGLARGYLERPELTAERFVPDPFLEGSRLYRTGDVARYRADGSLEFLGRTDHQVKLRGFRIELGEIEASLRAHPQIRDAVVVMREDVPGHKHLVAYLVTTHGAAPLDELRSQLGAQLPEYMIPSAFVVLDAIPLSVNGKVDRKALPVPEVSARTQPLIAPSSPMEVLLAGIWREVLGVEQLGVGDDFFELGGHSLLAMQVVSRIRDATNVELSFRGFFDAPTIRDLARAITGGSKTQDDVIPRGPRDEPARLSPMQEQLWYLNALDPSSVAYNIPFALRLRGPLDVDALSQSVDEIVRRHDVLRATIAGLGASAVPHQCVSPHATQTLRAEPVASEHEALVLATEEVRRGFDLERGPLIRTRLLRLGVEDHMLVLTMHHIISDGWSCAVFQNDLTEAYAALATGQPRPRAELAFQFADYASWERARSERGALANSLEYWRAHVAGAPLVLELPTDRPRPPVQTYAGARHDFVLSARTMEAVAKLGRIEGVTPFMTLFAVYGVLLHRYTGQDKILVGVPVANRNRTDTERMIGLFINTVAFAADLTGDPTFHEVLQRVRSATVGGFAHQDLPFHKLVEDVQPARDVSRSPIVQVMFAYQSTPLEASSETAGLTVTRMPVETGTSKFEVTLELEPRGAELLGSVEYNTDLFDSSTIARFVQHFEMLVEALVADPMSRVAEVPLLTPVERHQLVVAWNDTAREFPRDRRIEELFADQVDRTPDAVAARFEGASLTYRELDARANQLAHRLRELGVGPDTLVPIHVERSLEMLVGILGTLKAGGAYVPIDPEYPPDRVAFMLEDTKPPVILTQARFVAGLPRGSWHVLDLEAPAAGSRDNPPRVGTAENLAYGIYTSGSTGTPKCALVPHRGVVNFLSWMQETYRLDETDHVLQKSPLIFDASIRELFWPLLVGARVVVARPDGHKDVGYLVDVIRAEAITTINFVPALLDIFVEESALADCVSLRRVISGGEALSGDVCTRFYARSSAQLYNHYGPTETTVTSAFWPCPRDTADRVVPIGRPIANTQLYVLDARRQPVPIGVPGELYIGGAGLARGYLNRPELTTASFVPHPFAAGSRLYRTGDVVRYRADGALEFLGRTDHQVKIRGFRIELGEIEAALREHPAIREVVVIVREDTPGQKHLVAYLVATGPAPDELRSLLRARLPEYMIPSAFVILDAFPLLVNGKVDRTALPAPAWGARSLVAPRNPTEELVARIWREVLGVEQLGVTDDFFELGGHSLLAMQVVSRIRRALSADVPLRVLLQEKTIEGQARRFTRPDADQPIELVITRSDNPIARATIAQEQFWYLSQDDPDPTAYFITNVFVLEGPLDRALLERSYCELVDYHSIFRTKFREIDGLLHQIVLPQSPFAPGLEFEQRVGVPENRYDDEIKRVVPELMALPCDLAAGYGVIRGRLIALGDTRHLLVILIHHIASDGAAFAKQLFAGYAQLRDGAPTALPSERPLQYIDFAHARTRWAETPQGKAQRAYWLERVRNAQPLEIPFDFPRAPLDARRDALPFGIAPDLNYPPQYMPLPASARAAVIQAARSSKTTPYMIYLGALAWLFHRMSGQDEVSIQTTYNNRPEYPVLEEVQGPLAWWTHIRIDTSGKPTFRELVRRTGVVVEDARKHGVVEDYFQLVPHYLRRCTFNYLPLAAIPTEERAGDLRVVRRRQPFPRWKRHWDLHLTLMDFANDTVLVWTGTEKLYRHETVVALLHRYIDILAHSAD